MPNVSIGAELVMQARKLERKRAAIRKLRTKLDQAEHELKELQRQVALLAQAVDMPPAPADGEPLS